MYNKLSKILGEIHEKYSLLQLVLHEESLVFNFFDTDKKILKYFQVKYLKKNAIPNQFLPLQE